MCALSIIRFVYGRRSSVSSSDFDFDFERPQRQRRRSSLFSLGRRRAQVIAAADQSPADPMAGRWSEEQLQAEAEAQMYEELLRMEQQMQEFHRRHRRERQLIEQLESRRVGVM